MKILGRTNNSFDDVIMQIKRTYNDILAKNIQTICVTDFVEDIKDEAQCFARVVETESNNAKLDVNLIYNDFSSEKFCFNSEKDFPLILIQIGGLDKYSIAFMLFHELAHVLYDDFSEKQCNDFARKMVRRIPYDNILNLNFQDSDRKNTEKYYK